MSINGQIASIGHEDLFVAIPSTVSFLTNDGRGQKDDD